MPTRKNTVLPRYSSLFLVPPSLFLFCSFRIFLVFSMLTPEQDKKGICITRKRNKRKLNLKLWFMVMEDVGVNKNINKNNNNRKHQCTGQWCEVSSKQKKSEKDRDRRTIGVEIASVPPNAHTYTMAAHKYFSFKCDCGLSHSGPTLVFFYLLVGWAWSIACNPFVCVDTINVPILLFYVTNRFIVTPFRSHCATLFSLFDF